MDSETSADRAFIDDSQPASFDPATYIRYQDSDEEMTMPPPAPLVRARPQRPSLHDSDTEEDEPPAPRSGTPIIRGGSVHPPLPDSDTEDDEPPPPRARSRSRDRTRAPTRQFRLDVKTFALTYSQVPSSWTREYVCARLREIVRGLQREVVEMYVAKENHSEERAAAASDDDDRLGAGFHFHVYLLLNQRLSCRERTFDIRRDANDPNCAAKHHPNIKGVNNRTGWFTYISKEDTEVLAWPATLGDIKLRLRSVKNHRSVTAQAVIERGFISPDDFTNDPSFLFTAGNAARGLQILRDAKARLIRGAVAAPELRGFQQDIVTIARAHVEMFHHQPTAVDTRSVHWFVDEVGNSGKSFLGKHLMDGSLLGEEGRAFFWSGAGTEADVWAAFGSEAVVVIDLARTWNPDQPLVYTIIERLKDGAAFSSKYESRFLQFVPPAVFVFSNRLPKRTALSMDRWQVRKIKPDYTTEQVDAADLPDYEAMLAQ